MTRVNSSKRFIHPPTWVTVLQAPPEEPTLINTPISGAQTGSELRYKAVSILQVEETLSLLTTSLLPFLFDRAQAASDFP